LVPERPILFERLQNGLVEPGRQIRAQLSRGAWLLAENTGTVLEHEVLLRGVWGQEYTKDNDYLKVYIWHLRRKIEIDPRDPKLLLTEWGVGYRLIP